MSRSDVPAPVAPTEELAILLQGVLDRHFGVPRRMVRLERWPFAYRTSFPLEAVDVELADGQTLPLLLKDLSWHSLPEAIRRAKPAFLYDPVREIEAYQLLRKAGLGTAHYYGAVVDAAADRYWLVLERVAGTELYQVGEMEVWRQVARWLGCFHTRLAEAARWRAGTARLLAHNQDYYGIWPRRALAFARKGARRCPPPMLALLEGVAASYGRVMECLLALPATVIHGELYASNVLVQQSDSGLRVCPVDWEMAAIGPGLVDLAALSAGRWSEEQRRELAGAYRDGLSTAGAAAPEMDALLAALDCCHLHLAVQWLGWAEDWTPPAEHSHDWLAEVVRLSARLGL
jgi:Ser/Thr protein kinase RdoA (MazF antagonist)